MPVVYMSPVSREIRMPIEHDCMPSSFAKLTGDREAWASGSLLKIRLTSLLCKTWLMLRNLSYHNWYIVINMVSQQYELN